MADIEQLDEVLSVTVDENDVLASSDDEVSEEDAEVKTKRPYYTCPNHGKTGRPKKKYTQIKPTSHSGKRTTFQRLLFVDYYIETNDGPYSAEQAGFKPDKNGKYNSVASRLLRMEDVKDEILYRLSEIENAKTASATEILQYFTSVMRGEIKDQFGLDAPLAERTKAAQELAKRLIDLPNKCNNKETGGQVTIKLDWTRPAELESPDVKQISVGSNPICISTE